MEIDKGLLSEVLDILDKKDALMKLVKPLCRHNEQVHNMIFQGMLFQARTRLSIILCK